MLQCFIIWNSANLYKSRNIVKIAKSRGLTGAGYARDKECLHSLAEELRRKWSLETLRLNNNNTRDHTKSRPEDRKLMELAKDHGQWRALWYQRC
jgi:hypothetical protein